MAKEGKKSRWYQYSFEDVYGKEWKTKPQVPHAQLTLMSLNTFMLSSMFRRVKIQRKCVFTIISSSMEYCDK